MKVLAAGADGRPGDGGGENCGGVGYGDGGDHADEGKWKWMKRKSSRRRIHVGSYSCQRLSSRRDFRAPRAVDT